MTLIDPIETLRNSKTVAVVGASQRIHRASHHAVEMLLDDGYSVVPINPKYSEILGRRCYADLKDVPSDVQIDILNVFRRQDAVVGLLEDVAVRIARTNVRSVIWTQMGVSSSEAVKKANQLGLDYIENRCIMVELEKLAGMG